jgi:hypothetical protein
MVKEKTAEQLNIIWEKLLSHIGIHYNQDLHAELTTRENIFIPVPDYPPGVQEQHKLSEEKRLPHLDSFIQKYTRLLGTVNRQPDNTSLTHIEEEQLGSKQIGLEEKIASLTTSKDHQATGCSTWKGVDCPPISKQELHKQV